MSLLPPDLARQANKDRFEVELEVHPLFPTFVTCTINRSDPFTCHYYAFDTLPARRSP